MPLISKLFEQDAVAALEFVCGVKFVDWSAGQNRAIEVDRLRTIPFDNLKAARLCMPCYNGAQRLIKQGENRCVICTVSSTSKWYKANVFEDLVAATESFRNDNATECAIVDNCILQSSDSVCRSCYDWYRHHLAPEKQKGHSSSTTSTTSSSTTSTSSTSTIANTSIGRTTVIANTDSNQCAPPSNDRKFVSFIFLASLQRLRDILTSRPLFSQHLFKSVFLPTTQQFDKDLTEQQAKMRFNITRYLRALAPVKWPDGFSVQIVSCPSENVHSLLVGALTTTTSPAHVWLHRLAAAPPPPSPVAELMGQVKTACKALSALQKEHGVRSRVFDFKELVDALKVVAPDLIDFVEQITKNQKKDRQSRLRVNLPWSI